MRTTTRVVVLLWILIPSICVVNAADPSPVADAAERGDTAAVRALLNRAADASAAQADGMTALHWASEHSDGDLASLLPYAGANLRATTRLGGYAPFHRASRAGPGAVIRALVAAGADVNARTTTGATPLMFAAASGAAEAVNALLELSADPDATETANGETPLMFAAALDRADAVRVLVRRGANTALVSRVADVTAATPPEELLQEKIRDAQNARSAAGNP